MAEIYSEQSTFDWRRYGHWSTSASKARLCAFLLWQAREPARLTALERDAAYSNGDASLAMIEGFDREAAVAIELIIKAVIAKAMELRRASEKERVPASHDIPKLWQDAKLPKLERDNEYRLLMFKSILMWSGRYATPKSAKAWAEENRAFREFDSPAQKAGKLVFKTPITISWDSFARIYDVAAAELHSLKVSDKREKVIEQED